MPFELAQVVAALPLAVSLAAVVAAGTLWQGRRRSALNEALHELRRPLQALALATPGREDAPASERLDTTLRMATAALDRLDREINGAAPAWAREAFPARSLAEDAVRRWAPRAHLAGADVELRWQAAAARVRGDRIALAQALDNLLVNAIEHGGPRVELRATLGVGWLRLAIVDDGRASQRPRRTRLSGAMLAARLAGRSRRGHGLRVVRRTAAAHGGRFALRTSPRGTEAVLELPLLSGETP